jgi:2-C-methyl-D-erythritol 4-phosphate cytidylyltransferase
MSAWAVLVAAGTGERLGEERPKAFVRLGELPLLAEPLRRLDESPWVDAIVVAVPAGWEEPAILLAEELSATKVVASVTGGATRAETVRLALAEVPEDALVVLVHDAARPLVDDTVIERLLGGLAQGVDGVVPGLPLRDTVKRVEGGLVAETVDRSTLVAVQTPQAFVADRLRAAYAGALDGATDCASLVERAGGRVAVVAGDPRLLKVTAAEDLELVSRLLAAEAG